MSQTLDLSFFYLLANKGSLAATARELGITPPAVSKRLTALEARLGIRLVNRTTRSMSLTSEERAVLFPGRAHPHADKRA